MKILSDESWRYFQSSSLTCHFILTDFFRVFWNEFVKSIAMRDLKTENRAMNKFAMSVCSQNAINKPFPFMTCPYTPGNYAQRGRSCWAFSPTRIIPDRRSTRPWRSTSSCWWASSKRRGRTLASGTSFATRCGSGGRTPCSERRPSEFTALSIAVRVWHF